MLTYIMGYYVNILDGDILLNNKRQFKLHYFITLILTLTLLVGCSSTGITLNESDKITNTNTYNLLSNKTTSDAEIKAQEKQNGDEQLSEKDLPAIKENVIYESTTSEISVHFIDVGQADSIFIDYGDVDILIDGGNNDDGELVVNYLKSLGTDDLELMVATHPHEDHIGGLDTVIYNFDVEKIIKPALSENTKQTEILKKR